MQLVAKRLSVFKHFTRNKTIRNKNISEIQLSKKQTLGGFCALLKGKNLTIDLEHGC